MSENVGKSVQDQATRLFVPQECLSELLWKKRKEDEEAMERKPKEIYYENAANTVITNLKKRQMEGNYRLIDRAGFRLYW